MKETEHWKAEALRLRHMMDGTTDALMAHDSQGRFVDVNERACQNLGYSREELLRMSVGDVEANFLGRYVARYLGAVWTRLQPGQSIQLQGRHRRKDGSTFPVDVRVSLISDATHHAGSRILLACVRDMSEQLEAQTQLHEVQIAAEHTQEAESLESAARLFSLNQALVATLESLTRQSPSSSIELDAFLERVMKEACRQTGAVGGHLFLVDEVARFSAVESRTLNLHAVVGEDDGNSWHQPLSIGDSLSWQRLLLTRIPLVVNFERPDFLLWPQSATWHQKQGHTNAVSVALKDGQFLGILCLAFRGRKVDAEEIELAQTFAHQAALAVQLTRLAFLAEHEAARRAVLDERNRMAREIHDALAQSFTGIVAHLEAAHVVLPPDSQVKTLVEVARDLARNGLQEARRSLLALRPLRLEEGGLSEALSAILRDTESALPPAVLHIAGEVRPLSALIEAHLLRIAQEALANARCHSGASRIDIILRFDAQSIELSIRDDGQGFDTETPRQGGFGLTSMSERAAKIGGSWSIESQVGRGTQIDVVVPT